MKLTSKNVTDVFMDCLFTDEEAKTIDVDAGNFLKGLGVITRVGFNIERTTKHKQDVIDMLDCLPDSFKASGGGGMSFLNMCNDINDEQWTGEHRVMDQLICLAVALDIGSLMLTELQSVLPGGVPYFVYKNTSNVVADHYKYCSENQV